MKTLVVPISDDLMEAFEAVCEENRMDPSAAASEALRRYVDAERAHHALGSSEMVSVYSEFSGTDVGRYIPEDTEFPLS